PVSAPQGRADDYSWPRRDLAAPGTDPVATTTTFPMTPMIAERPSTGSGSLGTEGPGDAAARAGQVGPNGPRTAQSAQGKNNDVKRKQSSPFFFLFPGR